METGHVSGVLQQEGGSYLSLLENMSDGVIVCEGVDGGENFVFCEHNPAAEKITGVLRKDVIGRRVTEVFPGIEQSGLLDIFRRVFASGKRENNVTSQYQDERVVLWIESSVFKLPNGKIVAVYRDITERKQAEVAFSQANIIINRSPVVAFLWANKEGWPVQFVSENSVNLFGYSTSEFMNGEVSYNAIIHSDDIERVAAEVAENSGSTGVDAFVHAPYRILTRDGKIKWIHDTTTIRRDSHGKITHYEGIIYDISVQQRQQEKIEQLSRLRKTGLSIQRLLISLKDSQLLIQAICDVLVKENGYRSAWIVLLGEEQNHPVIANACFFNDFMVFEQEIRQGKMPPCINRITGKGGFIWQASQEPFCEGCALFNGSYGTSFSTVPLRYGERFYGVLTVSSVTDKATSIEERDLFEEIANDIALTLYIRQQELQRREQEAKLQVALDEYAGLYNNAPDMFASVEADSAKIQQCNQTLFDVLGYRKEELIGEPVFMLHHSDHRQEYREEVFPDFCKTEKIANRELTLQHKDGSPVPVTLDVTAIRDTDGKIIQSRLIFHDITEKKRLEEQMLITGKMTTIAGLAAGVAHEVNTPLSGILQSVQLIEMGLDPSREQNRGAAAESGIDLGAVQEYLRKTDLDFFFSGIKDSAIKAANIVADLLQFSRPQDSNFVQANIAELLDHAVSLARADYSLKKEWNILNVAFRTECSSDLPLISCVPTEIEQVLINLIRNSCQAMAGENGPAMPYITLRTRQHGKMAVIEVEDNGPGVEKGIRHKIFDPFFTTKEVGKGSGLGLSVSYSIICDRHGGIFHIEDTPGKGALFSIGLSIARTVVNQ